MPLQCRTYGLHQNQLLIDIICKGQPLTWIRCCNAYSRWWEFLVLMVFPLQKRNGFYVPGGGHKLCFCNPIVSWSFIKILSSGKIELSTKVFLCRVRTQQTHIGGRQWGKDKDRDRVRKKKMFLNKIITFTSFILTTIVVQKALKSCHPWAEPKESSQRKRNILSGSFYM